MTDREGNMLSIGDKVKVNGYNKGIVVGFSGEMNEEWVIVECVKRDNHSPTGYSHRWTGSYKSKDVRMVNWMQ